MDDLKWYLKKASDGSLFGPVSFVQLHEWAASAQISPMDRVSSDKKNWLKAPMIRELEMDYLIEVGPDQYYGPTSVGAVREFLEVGEITPETLVINCCDATHLKVVDLVPPIEVVGARSENSGRQSIRINLQQRIRELEEALMEERRNSEKLRIQLERAEAKIAELAPESAQY